MTQWIDNKQVTGDGELMQSLNPYNSEVIWRGRAASKDQVDLAVKAARYAADDWKQTPLAERQALLERFAIKVNENADHLANVIATETGKPYWEALTEVAAVKAKIAISLRAYHERTGERSKCLAAGKAILRHRPIGVMAVFGPYNFPAHLPNGHIVPSLLAGNTVVFKPSDLTPKTAEEIIKLWIDAELPKGVINLVQGGRETGETLAQHKNIDGLLFTGSAATGHLLHRQFAGQPEKMLALEMGGNNPMVISNHYGDLDATAYAIIQSAFISAGQRCTCVRRLYLPKGNRGDILLSRLLEMATSIKVGGQFDKPGPFMGAQISVLAAKAILGAQQRLQNAGGKSLLTARILHDAVVTPGIIEVSNVAALPDEEIFGPLLQVVRYDSLEQAIELANDTRYGLSAGLVSESDTEWQYFIDHIRAGIVNRNCALTGASGDAPFGGLGASGNLRPSAYYAADYCAYPMASIENEQITLPAQLSPGLFLSPKGGSHGSD